MTQEARPVLNAFEQLAAEEKQMLAYEILRRSLPFDDQELGAASAALLSSLDEEDDGAVAVRPRPKV